MVTLKRIVKHANEWEAEKAEEEKREPIVTGKITACVFRHTVATVS